MNSLTLLVFFGANLLVAQAGYVNWSKVQSSEIQLSVSPAPRPLNVPNPSGRITNGQIAERTQFPYQVGLLCYKAPGNYWCGGSIVSERWVLTAAHCVDNLIAGVDIYAGAWNQTDKFEKGQQILFVHQDKVIVHEHWNPRTILNDIALIRLPVVLEFNKYIQPVSLPKISESHSTYAGERAIASGWGLTSDKANSVTDVLQWIEVPIMMNSNCSQWYVGGVADSNICIETTGGYSTCSGDSGGPLVLASDPPILLGATSFGINLGCEVGWPSVFTRITSFLDWIADKSGVVNN